MKRLFAALAAVLCLWLGCASASSPAPRMPGPASLGRREKASVVANGSVQRSPFLDAALSMLEEGNPFILRYNAITGGDVQALFSYGIPYFYGGKNPKPIFAKYPEYVVYAAWQDSMYFKNGTNYIYGFDCAGFTQWVWAEAGKGEHDNLQTLLNTEARHVYCSNNPMPAWDKLQETAQVGDLIVVHHPGSRHVAMYMGTLRQFGYTETEVPALSPYLDYPLVIQSAGHPAFGSRFQHLIDYGNQKYRGATTTDGGVSVAVLGVEKEDAQYRGTFQDNDLGWFTLPDNTYLTVFSWSNVDPEAWCLYR